MRGFFLILASSVLLAQTATAPPAAPQAPAAPKPAARVSPSYKNLKYPPLRQVEIPNVDTFTLPNGLKLYLLENHTVPTINGFALIRTGNLFDPADKVGLAQITGSVMRTGGTRQFTGDQLDEMLENIAASVEAGIGESNGRVGFSCLKENVDEVLKAFHDVMIEPQFRPDKIELAKTQLRSSISRRNDSPGGIAGREFAELIYGRDNSYGWRMEYSHINNIKREDLLAFHGRYFFPANTLLAVYGDFSLPEMKAKLEALFGGWTVTRPPVPPFPKVTAKPAPGIFVASKDDVTQTFFEMGHLGGVYNDKDYAALEVMADILGGGFKSRLFQKVRTKLGYAYTVGASWDAEYDHPGTFRISGSTKSASTADTIAAIEEEVKRIRESEVADEEVRVAKDTVANGFVFYFDTRAKTLNRVLNYEYFGYPKDFIFQYQKAIAAVTKADIKRVAREYLKPENFTIVAVGNPAEFGKALDTLGRKVTPIDLSIPEPAAPKAETTAESKTKGQQMLARIQMAAGGASKLAAVRDLTQSAEVKLGQNVLRQSNQWLAPSTFRQELEFPGAKVVSFYDGKGGWIKTPQGEQPIAGPYVQQVENELFRMWVTLLLSDRNPDRKINAIDDRTLEISDSKGHSTRIQVDPSTGLPVGQKYAYQGGELEEHWSDYHDVSGLQFPYKVVVVQNGKPYAEVTVKDLKVNTGLVAEEMQKKP